MKDNARTLDGVIAAAFAVAAIAVASRLGPAPAAETDKTAVVGIIHPMPPIGNIDCCH